MNNVFIEIFFKFHRQGLSFKLSMFFSEITISFSSLGNGLTSNILFSDHSGLEFLNTPRQTMYCLIFNIGEPRSDVLESFEYLKILLRETVVLKFRVIYISVSRLFMMTIEIGVMVL